MTPFERTTLAEATTLEHDNIYTGAIGNGNYLWFWVTWSLNVEAFIDPLIGTLPAGTPTTGNVAPASNIREFFQAYIPSKEHYCVFPGRTTVVETRTGVYNALWDGSHGELLLTSAITPPARTD